MQVFPLRQSITPTSGLRQRQNWARRHRDALVLTRWLAAHFAIATRYFLPDGSQAVASTSSRQWWRVIEGDFRERSGSRPAASRLVDRRSGLATAIICLVLLLLPGCSNLNSTQPDQGKTYSDFLIGRKPQPPGPYYTPEKPSPAGRPKTPAQGAQPTRVDGEMPGDGEVSAAEQPADPLEALLGPVETIPGDVTVVSGTDEVGGAASRQAAEAAMEAAPPEPMSLQVSDLRPSTVSSTEGSGLTTPPRLSTANDTTPSIDQIELMPRSRVASVPEGSESASNVNPLRPASKTPAPSATASSKSAAKSAARPASASGWVSATSAGTRPPALPADWSTTP